MNRIPNNAKVRRLQRELGVLNRERNALQNQVDGFESQMSNSFDALVQSFGAGSELNNFDNIINNTGYNVITIQ